MKSFDEIRTVYFSGIGGIGMSALAQLLHAEGKVVTGSDMQQSEMTERLQMRGIPVALVQDGAGITPGVDLCIFTSAVPQDHPEHAKATQLGIPTMSYFEAVGEYMKGFDKAITISGTHGKSTTTSMIANIMVDAGLDPTVIVGTVVKEFGSNARAGGRKYIVVEACEYKEHMLNLRPDMIVLTNIEEDHLDYYRDLEHIVMTFQKYINHLPPSGVLFKNIDDSESVDLGYDGKTVLYGMGSDATVRASQMKVDHKQQTFVSGGETYTLRIPGKFNISNALAAIAVGRSLGISEESMKKTLANFSGVWRRFEVLGEYKGAAVISDYAHHPTAVGSTIKAAREFYPGRRIVAVFQPHQRSRTKTLFQGFVDCFAEADFTIIQEIYDVAGREESSDSHVSSQQLVDAVEKTGKYALFTPDVVATRRQIDETVDSNDVLIIMGAGNIYHLAEELVSESQ